MTRSVFLSYAREDRDVAEEVSSTLRTMNVTTTDPFDVVALGDSWVDAVKTRLNSADTVIVLISKNYLGSTYNFSELREALVREKRLVPLVIEKGARVPALLGPYVTLDISDPRTRFEKIRLLGMTLLDDGPAANDISTQLTSLEAQLQTIRQASLLEDQAVLTRTRRMAILTLLLISEGLMIATFVVALGFEIVRSDETFRTVGVSVVSALVGATISLLYAIPTPRQSDKEPVVDPDKVHW